MKPRILVIDDESAIRDSLKMILEYEGYEFLGAATGDDGIATVAREPVDMVFLDIKMPGMDGLETLGRIKSAAAELPVVMISGHGTVATAVEATKLGAFDFIEKPLATDRVLLAIRNAIGFSQLQSENRALSRFKPPAPGIVGSTPALREVFDAVGRAAPTSATVLIRGESGVGKELVARMIHATSLRSRERFIQVNCAAIPDELIESELFGHEKGSFTGATEKQLGKFELADRGTIFLDEIGDMSLKTQAKVLRVLQEGEVERLGSSRTLRVDVRVIAATNKDLDDEVEKGTFREDLFYRLNVIPILVPPLRERSDDIPALVRHFADLFSRENNFRPKRFTADALAALQQHRWKGNVRELRNTIERLIIMTAAETIGVDDLPGVLRGGARAASGTQAPAVPLAGGGLEKLSTLREFKESSERAFLLEKLRENAWNISKTADAIGTPRSNLYKKLEQYNIPRDGESS